MTSDKPPAWKQELLKYLVYPESKDHVMHFEPLVSQTMLMDAIVDVLVTEYHFRHLSAMQAAAAAVALAKKRAKHSFEGNGTQTEDDILF